MKKLAKLQAEYELGITSLNCNTPLKMWTEQWLETYRKPTLQESAYKTAKSRIMTILRPVETLPVSAIKLTHLQQCVNTMSGKSKSYITKAMSDIRSIFKYAQANEMITKNPTLALITPTGTAGKRRALTEDEITAFKAVVDKHEKGLLFALSFYCGLRPAEARAITWNNIDFKQNTVTVTNAVKTDSTALKAPKTEAGYRTIPLPSHLSERLKMLPHDDLSFVFRSEGNKPFTEQRYQRAWDSFYRLMDIEAGARLYRNKVVLHAIAQDITPYYLRHTYATQLAENGVDIKTAQYLLGHSDIKMTANIYTHITSKMIDEAKQKVENI